MSSIAAKPTIPIFDRYATVSSSHTDGTADALFSDSLPSGAMSREGDKLFLAYAGRFVGHATATRSVIFALGSAEMAPVSEYVNAVDNVLGLRSRAHPEEPDDRDPPARREGLAQG